MLVGREFDGTAEPRQIAPSALWISLTVPDAANRLNPSGSFPPRLMRPVPPAQAPPSADDLAVAERIVADSPRASAQLSFLGDKLFFFNKSRTAFIMYAVAGQSWVSLGDPVGPLGESVGLIEEFIKLQYYRLYVMPFISPRVAGG